MTAGVFVRGGSTAIVENVNDVENKDGFFHLYDVEESKTIAGAFTYHQKAIFANDIVEKIFIEDGVETLEDLIAIKEEAGKDIILGKTYHKMNPCKYEITIYDDYIE